MDAQQQVAKGLPQMIPAMDVGVFVSQHMLQGFTVQSGGNIDPGRKHAQHKGAFNIVAQIDPVLLAQGDPYPDAQQHPGNGAVEEHQPNTRSPNDRCHMQHLLQGDRLLLLRQQRGIDHAVHLGNAGVDGRGFRLDDVRGDHLAAGDQTEAALKGEGEHQPQRKDRPQQTHRPLGGFAQRKTQQDHSAQGPAGHDAHIQQFQKEGSHFVFSP